MPKKTMIVYFVLELLLLSRPLYFKNLKTRMTLMGAPFIRVKVIRQELILL